MAKGTAGASTGVDGHTGRRTQAQRTAAMRSRLLDATIECLVECGYANTTTPKIVERAGVTRGASVHHFGSKEAIVVAAVEHLAERRIESAIRQQSRVWGGPDPVSSVLEFLWESHQGDMFDAWIELWVAARTEPALAAELARVEPMVNSTLITAIAQLLPPDADQKRVRNALYTAMDALRGILVVGFVDPDNREARRRWDRASLALSKTLSDAFQSSIGSDGP